MIAVLIPTAILGIIPISAHSALAYGLYAVSVFGLGVVSAYLYRAMIRLEEMTWQAQLSNVIEKVTTSVCIADLKHQIIDTNDKFKRSPLSTLIVKDKSVVSLLAQGGKANDYREMLNKLNTRLKTQKTWHGNHFDLILVPLFAPNGKRFGTMVECIQKDELKEQEEASFALSSMWEQISIPFIFVDKNEQIAYVNLSLKTILIDQQAFIHDNLPQFNIDHPTTNTLADFLHLISKESASLNDLIMKGTIHTHLQETQYQISFQPLWNALNEIEGTLIIWQAVVHSAQMEQKEMNSGEDNQLEKIATLQSSHPLLVLDANHEIKRVSVLMMRLLTKDEEEASELSDKWLNMNFMTCVETLAPKISKRLRAALYSDQVSTFVAEHDEKICDWVITPLRANHQLLGHTVELIYPSRQSHLALEESLARMDSRRIKVEKDLTKFTRGIAKLNLYQKEALGALDFFRPEDYRHPLLKNTSKIVQLLGNSLHKLYTEVDNLKETIQLGLTPEKQPVDASMQQVNMLSSSIARNVKEIQYDFDHVYHELNKLKSLVKEQRGLNQAYAKPISKALRFSENALIQTVGFSEAVTLVLHQLHEKQVYINHLSNMIDKVMKNAHDISTPRGQKMALAVADSLEGMRESLAENKQTLCQLLMDFDKLKERWGLSSDNLKSCMHLSHSVEQASHRWETISEAADEYSEHLKTRLNHLADLTDKIQVKSTYLEVQDHKPKQEVVAAPIRQFDQIVISIDENKKKAEDVLFEGLGE